LHFPRLLPVPSVYVLAQEDLAAEFDRSHKLAMLPLFLYNLGVVFNSLVGARCAKSFVEKLMFLVRDPIVTEPHDRIRILLVGPRPDCL